MPCIFITDLGHSSKPSMLVNVYLHECVWQKGKKEGRKEGRALWCHPYILICVSHIAFQEHNFPQATFLYTLMTNMEIFHLPDRKGEAPYGAKIGREAKFWSKNVSAVKTDTLNTLVINIHKTSKYWNTSFLWRPWNYCFHCSTWYLSKQIHSYQDSTISNFFFNSTNLKSVRQRFVYQFDKAKKMLLLTTFYETDKVWVWLS